MHSLTLAIQNVDSLPDGGPLQVTIRGQRGLDIGRDQYLDWTLPDPGRIVSSRHCEVRFRDGAYWLHDISSNGTFVNGSPQRLAGPHRLAQGDRIEIGHYIIGVVVEGEAAAAGSAPAAEAFAPDPGNLWESAGAAPPIPAAQLRPPPAAPEGGDLMNWFVDIPQAEPAQAPPPPAWPAQSPAAPPPPVMTPPAPLAPPQPAPAGFGGDPGYWSIPPMPRAAPHPSVPPAAMAPAAPAEPPQAPMPASMPAPPPAPAPQAPAPAGQAPSGQNPSGHAFVALMARGAGVPEEVFARRSPEEIAELSGLLLRLTCENLKQMLAARAESKGLVRSTSQTMIQAIENNPLKFSPSAEDALRTMLGPPTASYLDARRAIEDSFRDLMNHQMNTYVAMQQALKILVEDIDPDRIEAETEKENGLSALVGSRKARLWDQFVTRWKTKTARHDNGIIDAFAIYFAEQYDKISSKFK